MERILGIGVKLVWVYIFLAVPIVIISFILPFIYDYESNFISYGTSIDRDTIRREYMEGVRYVLLPVVDEDLDRDIQASLGGFFSKEDIYHLIDVRNLYMTIYGTIVVSLMIGILALILVRKEKLKFLEGVIKIVFLTSLILLIIVVIVLLTWDTSFILFHKILFPYNTYWSLDPASSNLIKYFSPYFFQVTLAIYLTFILIEYPIFKLCIRWTRRRF